MILVGGENLMDMIVIGAKNGNNIFEAVPGGSPYNLAVAVGRQQQEVSYITPISQDFNGNQLVLNLTKSNVKVFSERVAASTSLAMVTINEGVASYAFYREGTAERHIKLNNLESYLQENVSIFHIGSLGLTGGADTEIWEAFANICKKRGIRISLDPNVRAPLIFDPDNYRARIKRLMKIADILKLSDEDLQWLYEDKNEKAGLEKILSGTNADIVMLTKGNQGSLVWHDNTWHSHPALPINEIKDTVGAGDTFMASLLVFLSKHNLIEKLGELDLSEKEALMHYANKAAALNCKEHGCNPPWAKDLI